MKNPSITLRTILDTRSNFHMFRQEFERANRNAAFFNHCNSEDGKCELHVHLFTVLASVWLQFFWLGTRLRPYVHHTVRHIQISSTQILIADDGFFGDGDGRQCGEAIAAWILQTPNSFYSKRNTCHACLIYNRIRI